MNNRPTIITLLAISLCALMAAVWAYADRRAELADWERAEGVVVDVGRRAIFAFTAADGRRYTVWSKVRSDIPVFSKGEEVEVVYPADAPEEAKIDSLFETQFLSMFLAVAALVTAALAGQFWREGRKRGAQRG